MTTDNIIKKIKSRAAPEVHHYISQEIRSGLISPDQIEHVLRTVLTPSEINNKKQFNLYLEQRKAECEVFYRPVKPSHEIPQEPPLLKDPTTEQYEMFLALSSSAAERYARRIAAKGLWNPYTLMKYMQEAGVQKCVWREIFAKCRAAFNSRHCHISARKPC